MAYLLTEAQKAAYRKKNGMPAVLTEENSFKRGADLREAYIDQENAASNARLERAKGAALLKANQGIDLTNANEVTYSEDAVDGTDSSGVSLGGKKKRAGGTLSSQLGINV